MWGNIVREWEKNASNVCQEYVLSLMVTHGVKLILAVQLKQADTYIRQQGYRRMWRWIITVETKADVFSYYMRKSSGKHSWIYQENHMERQDEVIDNIVNWHHAIEKQLKIFGVLIGIFHKAELRRLLLINIWMNHTSNRILQFPHGIRNRTIGKIAQSTIVFPMKNS